MSGTPSSSKDKLVAETEFRRRVKQRILSNNSSAVEIHKDFKSASDAGAGGAADLLKSKPGKNSRRDLMNKVLRDNEWPGLYWAQVPMARPKSGKRELVWLPFLLPHEWLPLYCKESGAYEDLEPADADEDLQERLLKLQQQLQAPFLVGLGLHGDGVPIGGTLREESLDCFNVNMVTSKKHSGLRVPFTCTHLSWSITDETFEVVMAVFCWSLRCLAAGRKPTSRHDGSAWLTRGPEEKGRQPWLDSDNKRAVSPERGNDLSLGIHAVLVEIRADWVFFNKLLKFPAWNTKEGLCWLCKCANDDMRTLDTASARWRFQRLLPGQFLAWCRRQNRKISELFTLPGVSPDIVFPDWMHSGDMGVAQDVIGHTFAEALQHLAGNSKEERCDTLWQILQAWYDAEAIPAEKRIRRLKPEVFLRKGQPNKLRSKAAQARYLVPFLPALCEGCMPDTPRGQAVKFTAQALAACYALLPQAPCPQMAKASRRFANSYCALWQYVSTVEELDAWQVKPKLHLFQELCEYSRRCPRDFWCYSDESFGNVCSDFGRRRGGADSPGKTAADVLTAWCCSVPLPHPRFSMSELSHGQVLV